MATLHYRQDSDRIQIVATPTFDRRHLDTLHVTFAIVPDYGHFGSNLVMTY